VARTTPRDARAAISGAIFEGTVAASALAELAQQRHVTQAILVEGRHRVRIYDPTGRTPEGFEPAAPTLEDAYLVMVRGLQAPPDGATAALDGATPDRAPLLHGAPR
jgi:hypothetical protein